MKSVIGYMALALGLGSSFAFTASEPQVHKRGFESPTMMKSGEMYGPGDVSINRQYAGKLGTSFKEKIEQKIAQIKLAANNHVHDNMDYVNEHRRYQNMLGGGPGKPGMQDKKRHTTSEEDRLPKPDDRPRKPGMQYAQKERNAA